MSLKLIKIMFLAVIGLNVNLVYAAKSRGGDGGGGGAGFEDAQGRTQTFADLGLIIEQSKGGGQVRSTQRVPNLEKLVTELSSTMFIPADLLRNLLTSIKPQIGKRRYYQVNSLEPQKMAAVTQEYQDEISKMKFKNWDKQSPMYVKIFAATFGEDTYLLPAFYDLAKEKDGELRQLGILFHEAIWAAKATGVTNDIHLADVIELEVLFVNYLQKIKQANHQFFDKEFYDKLGKVFKRSITSLEAAIFYDLKYSRKPFETYERNIFVTSVFSLPYELAKPHEIVVAELFGLHELKCKIQIDLSANARKTELRDYLEMQLENYPNNNTFAVLYDYLDQIYFADYEFTRKSSVHWLDYRENQPLLVRDCLLEGHQIDVYFDGSVKVLEQKDGFCLGTVQPMAQETQYDERTRPFLCIRN